MTVTAEEAGGDTGGDDDDTGDTGDTGGNGGDGGDIEEQGCNGTPQDIELSTLGDSFEIHIPNNGLGEYENNMDCKWTITVCIFSIYSCFC